MAIYSTRAQIGTSGSDSLSAGPGESFLLGLDGDDTLTSEWDDWEWTLATLAGGHGNDTYHASGDVSEIIDTGGNDTLYVPGTADAYTGAMLDQDLLLLNTWTGQTMLVLDFEGVGRIETFLDDSGQRLDASAVEAMVRNEGLGNVGYEDMQTTFLDYGVDPDTYQNARETDLVLARLDWNSVFTRLAENPNFDNAAIADAIQAEALPLLSPMAQQFWRESGAYEALLNTQYSGLEQNLPETSNSYAIDRSTMENVGLLYEAGLNRQPDEAGLNYWGEQVAEGMEMHEVALRFLDSDEFRQNFDSGSHAVYVEQLYANVLGREPDPSGEAFWIGELDSGARDMANVLLGFSDSPENRAQADWVSGLHFDEGTGNWLLM